MKTLLVQRVLMTYRLNFFKLLSQQLSNNLIVLHGNRHPDEMGLISADLQDSSSFILCKNYYFGEISNYLLIQLGVLRHFFSIQPEVIILEFNPRILSNYSWIFLSFFFRRKLILWGLGVLEIESKSAYKKFLYRLMALFAHDILAYSSYGKRTLLEVGIPEHKITVAFNSTVSPLANALTLRNQSQQITEFNFSHPLKLIFIGRLIASKRVSELISFVDSTHLPVQLDIYGDGPLLGELIKKNCNNVVFHGHCDQSKLAGPLCNAHFCVLPGRGGLAIQHAMASGCPVICGIADGTQEDFIEHGQNGYIAETDYFNNLETILETVIKDPQKILTLSKEAYQTIMKYNVETMATKFKNLITS